jgi:hypothetical protein
MAPGFEWRLEEDIKGEFKFQKGEQNWPHIHTNCFWQIKRETHNFQMKHNLVHAVDFENGGKRTRGAGEAFFTIIPQSFWRSSS